MFAVVSHGFVPGDEYRLVGLRLDMERDGGGLAAR